MSRTVIIDGDIIIYKASNAALETFESEVMEDEDCIYRITQYGSKQIAINTVEKLINKACDLTKSDELVVCLTDNSNFRKQINPNYKHNRKRVEKPLLYYFLRGWFLESGYKVFQRPNLEADDVMGILATSEKIIKGDKCLWSLDKDFKTIPCKFAKGELEKGKLKKMIVSPEEADWWFMYQTLIGDVTDGYKGCPKVGDKTARKVLGEAGEKSLAEMWEIVKEVYSQHGLTEDEALMNARMARILRNTDYDFKTKEVKLWQPTFA